jgi:hypothetical protein
VTGIGAEQFGLHNSRVRRRSHDAAIDDLQWSRADTIRLTRPHILTCENLAEHAWKVGET